MAIETREGTCFIGRTLVLSDGRTELQVTLDVGPRIISLRKTGGENLMYEDRDDNVNRDCSAVYGTGKRWHIYGGHRMWLSPEDESTYYPDNGRVAYRLTDRGAVFTPEAWAVVELQPTLEIRYLPDGKIELIHSFENRSEKEKRLCVWTLTVLRTGGELTVPLSREDTGLLANRNLVFWSYTDLADPRLTISDKELKLRGVAGAPTNIKVGLYKKDLEARYCLGGTTLKKTVPETGKPEDYPDFNCNMETYTSAFIHEIETLSPIQTIAPGKTITHTEIWEVK